MKRNILLVVACLALLVTGAGVLGCSENYVLPTGESGTFGAIFSQQNTGIWVTGEGTVAVVSDVAILSLGIEVQAATVSPAQGQAAEAMTGVMNELKGHGVAEKDIKTQSYNIYPVRRWDDGKEILTGYRVTNMVTAKIRQIDDAGAIIDAAVRAGGDAIRINSIGFTVDDPSAYYEEAREAAMVDAKAKAKQLAELSGVTLGKPTYINEAGGYIPVRYDYDIKTVAEAASPTPISPGETEIRLSVQVVYSIKS